MKTKIIVILTIVSLLFVFGCTVAEDTNNADENNVLDAATLNEVETTADEIEQEISEIDDLINSTNLGIEDSGLDENLI